MSSRRTQSKKEEANYNSSSKVVIGGEGFPTMKAVEERARAILNETPVGDTVNGQDMRSKWADFRREHARLRMLPRGLNSKISARDR